MVSLAEAQLERCDQEEKINCEGGIEGNILFR